MAWTAGAIETWVRESRFRFPGWGVWMTGHEPNTPEPFLYETAEYRILVFRLSTYADVASSMSHSLLGEISLSVPGVFVDYGFMPPKAEAEAMEKVGIPPLFGLSTKRPFSDFHMIAFSNAVAQELVNLPWLLRCSGIPLDGQKRMDDPRMPLLVMGGANAQSAFIACPSDLVKGDSLVDALYFGEAEMSWTGILDDLKQAALSGDSKKPSLANIVRKYPCVHAPGTGITDKRENAKCPSLQGNRSLIRGPVWYEQETLGETSILIDAGCPHLCAFCKEAWERRPYRVRPFDQVLQDIDEAKAWQGLDRVNLFSFSLTSHPDISRIIDGARERVTQVSMKSQRFDLMVKDPGLLVRQQSMGKTHFTFGLEGVSERIRAFLSKSIHTHHVISAIRMVCAGPVRQLKFFIILTGHETQEDFDECDALFETINTFRSRNTPLVLSVMPLIPMPHTPMQFSPFPDPERIAEGMRNLSDIARRQHLSVRESIGLSEARMAHLLLFSDHAQTEALVRNHTQGTYQQFMPEKWISSFERNLTPDFKNWVYGEKQGNDPFPWDILYSPDDKEKLYGIYTRLKAHLASGRTPKEKTVETAKTKHPMKAPAKGLDQVHSFWFAVTVSPDMAGVPVRFFQTALARLLMISSVDIRNAYAGPGPFMEDVSAIPTCGRRVFSLQFRKKVDTIIDQHCGMIIPTWGWQLEGPIPASVHTESAMYCLSLSARSGWLEKSASLIMSHLTARSIHYHGTHKDGIRTLTIDKSFAKKTGFEFIRFDMIASQCRWAVTQGESALGFLRKAGVSLPWESRGDVFRVDAILARKKGGGWINVPDGSDAAFSVP